jgi:hypothetical protein
MNPVGRKVELNDKIKTNESVGEIIKKTMKIEDESHRGLD